jgi:hypothetical protein
MAAPDPIRDLAAILAERAGRTRRDDACLTPEHLARLVTGEATDEERGRAADHLAVCGACSAEYRLAASLGDLTQASTSTQPPAAAGASWAGIALPLAASILLAVGGVVAWRMSRVPPQAQHIEARRQTLAVSGAVSLSAAFTPDKPAVVLSTERVLAFQSRGNGSGDFAAEFGDAIEPYRRNDFAGATAKLEALANKHPEIAEAHFYLGASRLLDRHAPEAVASLRKAESLANGALKEDASWYAALAEAHAGQRNAARASLDRICAQRGRWAERACTAAREL